MRGTAFLADVKTIKAVAELWPLAFMLVALVALGLAATVFRKQTRVLLERLVRFSFTWGKAAVAINDGGDRDTSGPAPQTQAGPSDGGPDSERKAAGTASAPPEEQDWHTAMLLGFVDEDADKARLAYQRLQADETDEATRIENEASFLFWSFRYGDASAQAKLQSLEVRAREFPDTLAQVRMLDAACYSFAGDKLRAAAVYQTAAQAATTSLRRAEHFRSASRVLRKAELWDEARELLVKSLSEFTDPEALAVIYGGLADLFDEKSEDLRAILLEKALQHTPLNKDLQFSAGYAYSNAEENALAILHYEKSLAISTKDEMTANNLGVSLKALKLPILAVEKYKRSIKLGGTLAAANLGEVFADAGAADEAEQILADARVKDGCHQNVFFSLNKLQNSKTGEAERKKKLEKAAERQQRFLLVFADRFLAPSAATIPAEQQWLSPGGKEASVKVKEQLEIVWEVADGMGLLFDDSKYRFQGKLDGQVSRGAVEKYRNPLPYSKPDGGHFERFGRGYCYFDGVSLVIGCLVHDEDEFREFRITPAATLQR